MEEKKFFTILFQMNHESPKAREIINRIVSGLDSEEKMKNYQCGLVE